MRTTRFNVVVRRIATGCDYHVSLFALDAEKACERATERARFACGLSRDKMRELHGKGIAVFRVVSCEISPNQSRPSDSIQGLHKMRFYAACLASYNNGVLHGAWIDASDDIEEMQDAINAMLRASPFPNVTVIHPETGESVPSAEEWAIHDHEGFGQLSEYAGLASIVEAFNINEVAEKHSIPFAVLQEAMTDAGADDADDFVSDRYRGKYDSWQSFAEEFMSDMHDMSEIPEWVQSRIDWAGVGHDLEVSGDFNGIRHDSDYSLYIFWNH